MAGREKWITAGLAALLLAAGSSWFVDAAPVDITDGIYDTSEGPDAFADEGDMPTPGEFDQPDQIPPSAQEIPAISEEILEDEAQDAEGYPDVAPEMPYYHPRTDEMLRFNVWAAPIFRAFNHSSVGINEFAIRRARFDVRGALDEDWAYFLAMNFAGRNASLWEAWLEYRYYPAARFKVGQFKEPFSYDQLLSIAWLPFIERSMGAHNLAPARDIGLQMAGDIWDYKFTYAVGIFNGSGPNIEDFSTDKEAAARILISPWYDTGPVWIKNFTVGGSGTWAFKAQALTGRRYVTEADTPFLTFTGPDIRGFPQLATVRQLGEHKRWGVELEWLIRWWKLYGEYIWDRRDNVHRFELAGMPDASAPASALPPLKSIGAKVENRAWYAAMLVTLTGEDEVTDGPIAPRRPFSPFSDCNHGWGAWELGARYEQFRTNEEPFEKKIVRGANEVDAWTIGLNWYPTVHIRFQANVYHADFNKDLSFLTPDRLFRKETAYIFLAQYYY
jgi:phosphate-selective porin